MKERPILFNAEMVRAVLDGRKTQTRRVVKPQPVMVDGSGPWQGRNPHSLMTCPYGLVGDRLYVKERIQRGYCGDMSMSHYVADGSATEADAWPWKRNSLPSIFCPLGLSRITLEITGVRVERVQNIWERDVRAEGVETFEFLDRQIDASSGDGSCYPTLRSEFKHLWDSINAKRGYGWEVNPWVWVIEFKRINSET